MPSLYFLPLSPPSRSVLLTAKVLNVDLDLITVNLLAGDHLKPEFVKLNPQHTIPLLDDNGVYIHDSHAICAYLVDKYAKNDTLYPKDLVKRAHVHSLLHFDSGFLFARVRGLYEPILYYGSTDLNAEKVEYISRAWPILEGFLETNKFVCGNELTIADICCEATICSVDKIVPIDSEKFPKLTAWRKRVAELPNYTQDCHVGGEALQDYVLSKVSSV